MGEMNYLFAFTVSWNDLFYCVKEHDQIPGRATIHEYAKDQEPILHILNNYTLDRVYEHIRHGDWERTSLRNVFEEE